MKKYTQLLGRVVTISTYAIIFCVIGNMVMPALIVDAAQTQAVSSSTTAQAQADAAKKALDKAQADAKAAMYKEIGLNSLEIAFSNSFDMDAINQKVDKYVTYDKNGNATLNANAYRKDGTVKLSKANTGIVISITNKQISKYNKDVKAIMGVTDSSVTKTILARGVELKVNIPVNNSVSKVSAASLGGYLYPKCDPKSTSTRTWTGYTIDVDNCYVMRVLVNHEVVIWAGGGVGTVCGWFGAGLCSILAGFFTFLPSTTYAWIENMNLRCGQRGIYIIGTWWQGYYPVPTAKC